MPSYTTSLRLVQPATGEYSGTWGTQVNNGITALVDTSVAGTASITMTAADYTLSTANGATDEARAMFLVLGGAPGAARNVICPAVSKLYFVTNNTTGGFAQTVKTAAGTGISVPNGASMTLRCDGTNVVEALNAFGNLTINTGKVLLPNTQSYAIKTSTGSSNDVVTLNASNVLILGGGGATDSIEFWNQGLQRMTLDSSGNLGLGGTPSAAIAGTTIEIGVNKSGAFGALGSGPVDNAYVSANAYPTGSADPAFTSWKYTRTGFAAKYEAGRGGAHQWFTAPSGIAGTTNVISSGQSYTTTGSGNQTSFGAPNNNVGTTWTATSSGTLIAGGVVQNITFTQAMTLDASGNLLVGTTGNVNNYKTHILTTGAGAAIGIFQNNATTPYGINVYYGAASPNNSNANTSFLYCNDLTTLRIQLASNGGVINYQANNSNLSDRREKIDFAPAKSYLDTICAIPVQTFKYIDQTDDAPTLGVVAQDVQAVAPELVMESNWGTEDNPKMRLSIYQTDLQYALMKCIQEQQELIKDLRARVAALEAK